MKHKMSYPLASKASREVANFIERNKTTINIVTVSYSFTQFSTLAKIHTTTAREPSIYVTQSLHENSNLSVCKTWIGDETWTQDETE